MFTSTASRQTGKDKPCKGVRFYWDEELPGFGLRVRANGKKHFIARYRVGGGKSGRSRRVGGILGHRQASTTQR